MNAPIVPVRQQQIAVALYGALTMGLLIWVGMFSSINGSLQDDIEAKSQIIDGLHRRCKRFC